VVALLDKVDSGDDISDWSERTDMDDAKDAFCVSSALRASSRVEWALDIGVGVGELFPSIRGSAEGLCVTIT
jgi:hypothetical protein